MANFVEVKYHDDNGELVEQNINTGNICILHPVEERRYLNFSYTVRIRFNHSINEAYFKTKEEAQAFHDKLRGKKEIPTDLAKDIMDRLNLIQKEFTDLSRRISRCEQIHRITKDKEEIEKELGYPAEWFTLLQEQKKEDGHKYLELIIEILKQYEDFVLNLEGKVWGDISQNHWDKAVESIVRMQEILFSYRDKKEKNETKSPQLKEALSQLREEASKREPSIKDPNLIPVMIECGDLKNFSENFLKDWKERAKADDPQETMGTLLTKKFNPELFIEFHTKPLQDKLDRIRDIVYNLKYGSEFANFAKGLEQYFDQDTILEIASVFYASIKAILDEGEE